MKISFVDINECEDKIDDCDTNADCENTIGGFECTCKTGYTGNGRECEGRKMLFLLVFILIIIPVTLNF